MPKLAYEDKKFGREALEVIRYANRILDDYAAQGYDLTLRQLYYQFVARDVFANVERNYKRLGKIVSDARLSGYIDWDAIVDRTRNVRSLAHWDSPADLVEAAAKQFRVDLWDKQSDYVEVWIEKDALVGVISGVCERYDAPYFSCRGYTSQSEMWSASQRLLQRVIEGKSVTILHLGDHDPSGIDMTRDIRDRLGTFIATDYVRHVISEQGSMSEANISVTAREAMRRITVKRIALNQDQIDQYNPPPNPAKVTDSRFESYRRIHGDESWELDALEPTVLSDLVSNNLEGLIDGDLWDEAHETQREGREQLQQSADRWDEVVEHLEGP